MEAAPRVAGCADERTLETLDFQTIRERAAAGARTQRGRRIAGELTPFGDFARVRFEQRATAEMRELISGADFYALPAIDTADATAAAEAGMALPAAALRSVADAISAAAAAFKKTRERPSETIASLTASYRALPDLHRALVDAIDERANVLDRASPALARVRKNLKQANADARERVASLLRSPAYAKAIQDTVVTIREGRFVVPVKAEFSGAVPGIVHDTSSTGQTLFIEPLAALEANNRLRTLRVAEEREVTRVLEELSRRVGAAAAQIETNVEMLARLDVLAAKALLAVAMDAVAPELVEESTIVLCEGRHPLLGARAVPQSFALDERTRLIAISGPNMGGKTVALKMAGLFVAMAYAGMQLPAGSGTRIGRFTRIFTDIGDEQSILENISTFSAHLGRIREIVDAADDRSLVLIDEIGGGTEPAGGAALAIAILERLLAVRACGIVTTHATELKLFAHATPGVVNAGVRFDPQTFAPTYQLDVGMPGLSLAFPLARSLGIPAELVARAESLIGTREREYENALAELSETNAALHAERDEVVRERVDLERQSEELRLRREALAGERRAFAEAAELRMQQALREFTNELQRRAELREDRDERTRRPKVTSAQSALLSRTLEQMRRDLGIEPEHGGEPLQAVYARDDRVRVLSFGQEGTVIADNGENLLVAIGPMRTLVSKDDVRLCGGGEQRVRPRADRSRGGDARLDAAARTTAELDVRGKRYAEAEPLVERWIDDAQLAGSASLRLIHGKGTGMLGRGLQEYLRGHPAVKNVRYGDENEGGGGVTVFELR